MTAAGWIEIALYVAILTAITPLLGGYMTRVYRGELRSASSSARSTRSAGAASRTGRPTRSRC